MLELSSACTLLDAAVRP